MSKQQIPRPEYPNPQFERADWLNLNGEWEFEIDDSKSGRERELFRAETFQGKITVPFCPESRLSGVGYVDFMNVVWYRREVDIPAEKLAGRVFLRFGAVDYEAFVYVNGEFVGSHKGGYVAFGFEITGFIRAGKNVITVCAEDDVRSPRIPSGKQSEKFSSHGCHYTRTTGIWQTVWLEFTPKSYIKGIKLKPDYINGTVGIQADVEGGGIFTVEAFFGGKAVGSAEKSTLGGNVCVQIKLSEIHLWDVSQGNLYNLRLTLGDDAVCSYFGLRGIQMDGGRFMLNGRSVFMRLVLDQGFYPDGIYTAATEDDLVRDIELAQSVGFNGARLHEKVFEPRFLYHCDRLGYLVWGEYPNWGIDVSDPANLAAVLPEWCEALERDVNHPSIIGWCPFNETWDYDRRKQWDDLLRIVYRVTKLFDKTRPCIDTSGNFHTETDIFDVHDYEQNPDVFKEHYDRLMTEGVLFDHQRDRQRWGGEPVFVSEYGGIKWIVDDDFGDNWGWGYGEAPKSEEEFLDRYKRLTDTLLDNDRMCGFCYTQLYDVEQEKNGLFTYERKAKFDPEFFKKVNSRKAAIE
ncbi:MAG: beta-galactosidase [Oscillospiraceae bacterium]|nr:beta-galactosidase [Oscillospiraceae bacterium]